MTHISRKMDEFLRTWTPREPVDVKEFASKYFAWCDAHLLPKTKVNSETLAPHGLQVTPDGQVVIGIPKKSVE